MWFERSVRFSRRGNGPTASSSPAKRFELRGELAQEITVDRGLSAIMCQIIAPQASARHSAKQLSAMASWSRVAGDVQALPPNQVVPTRSEPLPRLSPALESRASRAGSGRTYRALPEDSPDSPGARTASHLAPIPWSIRQALPDRQRCTPTVRFSTDLDYWPLVVLERSRVGALVQVAFLVWRDRRRKSRCCRSVKSRVAIPHAVATAQWASAAFDRAPLAARISRRDLDFWCCGSEYS